MNDIKQVICIRTDLKMRKGKMCTQAAHAAMKVLFDRKINQHPMNGKKYSNKLVVELTDEMAEWVYGVVFKKITCKINSKEELLELEKQAKESNIPCSIIEDLGLTEFHGNKTLTAIAIGPDDSEKIDQITDNLELL